LTTLSTIRFHLAEDALERVCFAYAPMQEAVFSLHVLAEPQRHPLQHPWVREMRALPLNLRREIAACSFALGAAPPNDGAALPNPLGRFPSDTSVTFEQGIAGLRALPADRIAAELTDAVAVGQRTESAKTRGAVRMAREDPLAFMERLCRLLEDYWEAAFEKYWLGLEPHLAESIAQAGRLMWSGGLYAFVNTLGPRVRASPSRRRFDVEMSCAPQWGSAAGQGDADFVVTETFTFTPSVFSWPHIWYSVEDSWPVGMTYHTPFVMTSVAPRVPPADLVRILRACGDDVRLRALRWIAERPRSTQELAPLVGLTESTLSKHLRQLTESGVVRPRRDGHYVLYELRRDRLESLTESLLDYLAVPGGRTAHPSAGPAADDGPPRMEM
jgi:DNA-binding transcriptional ArsR family regulator